MIYPFKYKYMCTVIVFIVIFLFIIFLKAASRSKCILEEPIDVVYTWVNGSDPLFIQELNNHTTNSTSQKIDKSKIRYFDRYELKFSLRSLEKYAPWIRNVYIVTNGQIPYWLNLDYERVHLVTHEDIFTNKYDLPTFSSPAIETHLHRIPGLSKKFLYFNDDIYLGAPIYLDDFYSPARGYLVYLDYPMQSCAKGCPWIYVHDGQCDKECNVWACQMDGGDCKNNLTNSLEVIRNHSAQNITYLHTTTTTSTTIATTTKEQSTTLTTSQNATIIRNETDFKMMFAKLPPNLERYTVKRLVDDHNRNKLIEYKIRRRRMAVQTPKSKKKYFDAYRESLQHTNRLFNIKYGFTPRYVPAHMPFLIDVDVMTQLQESLPQWFAITSSNRYRSKNDMQFAFSYYHFLMTEKSEVGIEEIFDHFDTDLSGTWSDREIRTILTRMHDIPLSTMNIDDFDNLLINCSNVIHPKETIIVPEYERYIDSVLPTIFKDLVIGCENLKTLLLHHFGKKSKYAYEIIKNVSKYVTFEMIESDIQSTVIKLDKIRKYPKKFVCLNDNVYRKYNESTINAIWYDFYLSLLPLPSKFELPSEFRNRFQYVKDLRWYQTKMTLYLYGCILIFIYFIVWILCKNKFIYFLKNKLFC